MPQLTANPTESEIEDLETWMSFYNSTFTFITNTAHEYNCTLQGLGYGLYYAITEWATGSMGTEQLMISKITWNCSDTAGARTFTINVNNTGTKDVTVNQIQVNYGAAGVTQPTTVPLILKASTSTVFVVGYSYTNGTNYDISVVTTSGYKFTNSYAGGQNTG